MGLLNSKSENGVENRFNILGFSICMIIGIASSVSTVILFVLYIKFSGNTHLIQPSNCLFNDVVSACYFDRMWDSSSYLSALTSFYNTVIVVLLTVITLIGALAFLSVKHSAKSHVDAQLPSTTSDYFKSEDGQNKLKSLFSLDIKRLDEEISTLSLEIKKLQSTLGDADGKIMSLNDKVIDLQNILEEADNGIITSLQENDDII